MISHSVLPNSLQPQGLQSTRFSVHGIFQARILEQVAISWPGDPPHSGMELVSPVASTLAGKFFTTEPPGNTIKNFHRFEFN